jgi:5-oxoprolinase (ATP-hydrolysing)
VEVDERVVLVTPDAPRTDNDNVVTGVTGEEVRIEHAPDVEAVRRQLQAVYDTGIRSLAVVFMHAYTFREHERIVGQVAKEIGFTHVSLSSEVMPMVKIVPRGFTTCVDAYLTPVLLKYIRSFSEGFDENFDKVLVTFMQSDGGLTPVTSFSGNKAILSGPAGGVVGFSTTGYDPTTRQPLIGFDMGGTSTDVSRFAGEFEHVFESTTAGVTIQSPQLDINTVAAGGGSKLFFNNGLFVVGPDSVGAHPGPVCYRKGGQLAVTDANLVLGRLLPQYFPKLFGPSENEPLDAEGTRRAFEALADEINALAKANGMATKTVEEIALGYLQVANEAMCRPIRNLTNMKGYDVTTHALVCFGGAGPQHCCAIAKALGMRRVIVHPYSGILSAYGLSMADLVVERQMPTAEVYNPESLERCKVKLQVRVVSFILQKTE